MTLAILSASQEADQSAHRASPGRRAGPPYRRLAVLALDGPQGTHVELVSLGVFLARLGEAIEKEEVPEARAFMSTSLAKARGYYDRRLIPEWLTFAEGGVELNRIEPPDGTW